MPGSYYQVTGTILMISEEGPTQPRPYRAEFLSKNDDTAWRRVPETAPNNPQVLYEGMVLRRFEGPGKTGDLEAVPSRI